MMVKCFARVPNKGTEKASDLNKTNKNKQSKSNGNREIWPTGVSNLLQGELLFFCVIMIGLISLPILSDFEF